MTKRNKAIFDYLNDYILGNESDFAIFLNGKWGCGKTYFINSWIEFVKGNYNLKNFDIDIKPLYVSLYGLHSIKEISNAIRRVLHPIWNSKTAGKIKKAALQLGSIALKYNLNGGTVGNDGEMSIQLDLMDILTDDDADTKIKGKRILIFDDFERCLIPKNELLGYINNFVEHSSCYVIIIGDETKIKKDESKIFEEIKEKTIGREFKIEPDISSAIDGFIEKIGSTNINLLKENKTLINDEFRFSRIENLRILNHALNDYNQCLSKLKNKDIIHKSSYPSVAKNLLANFIMAYLELLSSGTAEVGKFEIELEENVKADLTVKKEDIKDNTDRKNYLAERRDIYKDINIAYNVVVPELGYCDLILNYLYEGYFDIDSLIEDIKVVVQNPIQYLCNIYQVTDEGFSKYYPQVKAEYFSGKYNKILDIFDGGVVLIYYSSKGVDNLNIGEIIGHACEMLHLEGLSQSQLHDLEIAISRRNFYFSEIGIKKDLDDFTNALHAKIEEAKKNCKDDLAAYWESLNSKSVENIEEMLSKPTPDRSTTYDNVAIFSNTNIDKLVSNLLNLNNQSIRLFYASIVKHYNMFINTSNAVDFVHYYVDDIEPLKEMADKLRKGIDEKLPIKGLQIKQIADKLEYYSKNINEINKKKALSR